MVEDKSRVMYHLGKFSCTIIPWFENKISKGRISSAEVPYAIDNYQRILSHRNEYPSLSLTWSGPNVENVGSLVPSMTFARDIEKYLAETFKGSVHSQSTWPKLRDGNTLFFEKQVLLELTLDEIVRSLQGVSGLLKKELNQGENCLNLVNNYLFKTF